MKIACAPGARPVGGRDSSEQIGSGKLVSSSCWKTCLCLVVERMFCYPKKDSCPGAQNKRPGTAWPVRKLLRGVTSPAAFVGATPIALPGEGVTRACEKTGCGAAHSRPKKPGLPSISDFRLAVAGRRPFLWASADSYRARAGNGARLEPGLTMHPVLAATSLQWEAELTQTRSQSAADRHRHSS